MLHVALVVEGIYEHQQSKMLKKNDEVVVQVVCTEMLPFFFDLFFGAERKRRVPPESPLAAPPKRPTRRHFLFLRVPSSSGYCLCHLTPYNGLPPSSTRPWWNKKNGSAEWERSRWRRFKKEEKIPLSWSKGSKRST